jgi:hypothetical protein
MNDQARVWIYQANRIFNEIEITQLQQMLIEFTKNWTAHNQQLKADFELKYDRFIILMVDESQAGASGCSIDKSVHLMKQIEQKFNVDLFDRFHISWKDKNVVKSTSKENFELLIKGGLIDSETIVFNNLVTTYNDYLTNWEISFKNSWHPKVFKLKKVV